MPPTKNPPPGKAKPQGKGAKTPPGSRKSGGGLNKKVGGLPIWAWGALVLGAVAVGLYFRRRSGGGAAVAQPDTSGQNAAGQGDVGGGAASENPDLSNLAGAIEDLSNQLGAGIVAIPPPGEPPPSPPGNEATAPPPGAPKTAFYVGATKGQLRDILKGANQPHKAARAKHPRSKPQKAVKHTAHPASPHPQHERLKGSAQPKPKGTRQQVRQAAKPKPKARRRAVRR